MPPAQAIYTVTLRAQVSAATDGDAVIQFAFSSSLQPGQLAPRLAGIIDEHLASPGSASSWWSEIRSRRTRR